MSQISQKRHNAAAVLNRIQVQAAAMWPGWLVFVSKDSRHTCKSVAVPQGKMFFSVVTGVVTSSVFGSPFLSTESVAQSPCCNLGSTNLTCIGWHEFSLHFPWRNVIQECDSWSSLKLPEAPWRRNYKPEHFLIGLRLTPFFGWISYSHWKFQTWRMLHLLSWQLKLPQERDVRSSQPLFRKKAINQIWRKCSFK